MNDLAAQPQRKRLGTIPGIIACIFAALGILTLGIVFVPLAALIALLGTVLAIISRNLTAAGINALAWVLVVVGFITSPVLMMAVGLTTAGTLAMQQRKHQAEVEERNQELIDKKLELVRKLDKEAGFDDQQSPKEQQQEAARQAESKRKTCTSPTRTTFDETCQKILSDPELPEWKQEIQNCQNNPNSFAGGKNNALESHYKPPVWCRSVLSSANMYAAITKYEIDHEAEYQRKNCTSPTRLTFNETCQKILSDPELPEWKQEIQNCQNNPNSFAGGKKNSIESAYKPPRWCRAVLNSANMYAAITEYKSGK